LIIPESIGTSRYVMCDHTIADLRLPRNGRTLRACKASTLYRSRSHRRTSSGVTVLVDDATEGWQSPNDIRTATVTEDVWQSPGPVGSCLRATPRLAWSFASVNDRLGSDAIGRSAVRRVPEFVFRRRLAAISGAVEAALGTVWQRRRSTRWR
jgi:hypothetical protein